MSGRSLRRQVAIVGVGFSEVKRRSEKTLGQLTVSACLRAIEDAGLRPADIDGIANYPHPSRPADSPVDGVDIVGVNYVSQALRLDALQWACSIAAGTITASAVAAVHALAAGACNYALIWRGMHNPPGQFGRVVQPLVRGDNQFIMPAGFGHNVVGFALPYSRYMAKYGATREDHAHYIVRNRANAALNPDAVFYGQPIDREDYLNARMIAEPLSILDCDMPVDGAGALVLTTVERAKDLRQKPAVVQGCVAHGLPLRPDPILNLEDFMASARRVSSALWSSAGVGPDAITQAQLYDGFSYMPYFWFEAFGFCKEGEAFLALQDDRHALAGSLPINTSGGALGAGRLHGTPQLIEAVLQIQGRSGARQIRNPSVALVESGDPLHMCGAMVLTD